MVEFKRLETLLRKCRLNLYWVESETGEEIDLRDAKLVSIKDNEITLFKDNLYWSYDIDVLEAKIVYLTTEHIKSMREIFKQCR